MNPEHVREYSELFEANFVEVGGKVYSRIDLEASDPLTPSTVDENTSNSERFYFFPQDSVEDVLRNHALATALQVVWESRLAILLPHRPCRCFVSNEYVLRPKEADPSEIADEGVETVLRLWSLPADDPEIDAVYRIDELARDRVLWPEYDGNQLVPLEEVFAVIKDATHPARIQTLQARWPAI